MSNYFEALVFGHALSRNIFYRAIRAADVRAIVIISCACLSVATGERDPASINQESKHHTSVQWGIAGAGPTNTLLFSYFAAILYGEKLR
jgi:hypothetical protein